MAANWTDNSGLVRDFAYALKEAGVVNNSKDVVAQPYKYQAYYDLWAENDFPVDDEDDNWVEFVNAMSSVEEEEE